MRQRKLTFYDDIVHVLVYKITTLFNVSGSLHKFYHGTRNTFCGTWYLPHSHVHNERIIMAGCMAHEREGYISTSGLKCDVTVVFLDPDFL